jgi:hypothetical protein
VHDESHVNSDLLREADRGKAAQRVARIADRDGSAPRQIAVPKTGKGCAFSGHVLSDGLGQAHGHLVNATTIATPAEGVKQFVTFFRTTGLTQGRGLGRLRSNPLATMTSNNRLRTA